MTFVIGQDGKLLDVIASETNMDSHADKALATLRAAASPYRDLRAGRAPARR